MPKILIADDDRPLVEIIRNWLLRENYDVETVFDGREAADHLKLYKYDLIVLDWELPHLNGLEICTEFRSAGGSAAIIFLTGRNRIIDKSFGFNAGADDYLTKPFQMEELSLRIKALLRRPHDLITDVLTVNDLVMDPRAGTVFVGKLNIRLQPREFALLEFFMRHPEQLFSAEVLLERVWSDYSDATELAVRSCVAKLRKKLQEAGSLATIENLSGRGYRMGLQN